MLLQAIVHIVGKKKFKKTQCFACNKNGNSSVKINNKLLRSLELASDVTLNLDITTLIFSNQVYLVVSALPVPHSSGHEKLMQFERAFTTASSSGTCNPVGVFGGWECRLFIPVLES